MHPHLPSLKQAARPDCSRIRLFLDPWWWPLWCFLLDPFYRWGRVYKRKFCLYVCPSSLSFSKILFLSFPSPFFFSSSDQIFSLSQYLPPSTYLQARCFPSFLSLFFFHFPYYPTPNIFFYSSTYHIFSSISFSLARGRVWPGLFFIVYIADRNILHPPLQKWPNI